MRAPLAVLIWNHDASCSQPLSGSCIHITTTFHFELFSTIRSQCYPVSQYITTGADAAIRTEFIPVSQIDHLQSRGFRDELSFEEARVTKAVTKPQERKGSSSLPRPPPRIFKILFQLSLSTNSQLQQGNSHYTKEQNESQVKLHRLLPNPQLRRTRNQ